MTSSVVLHQSAGLLSAVVSHCLVKFFILMLQTEHTHITHASEVCLWLFTLLAEPHRSECQSNLFALKAHTALGALSLCPKLFHILCVCVCVWIIPQTFGSRKGPLMQTQPGSGPSFSWPTVCQAVWLFGSLRSLQSKPTRRALTTHLYYRTTHCALSLSGHQTLDSGETRVYSVCALSVTGQ